MFSMKDHIVNNFVVIVKKIVIDNKEKKKSEYSSMNAQAKK